MDDVSPRARAGMVMRALAALVGSAPPSLYVAVALARFLPATQETRFVVGFVLFVPLWVTVICLLFLVRSTPRAWGLCAAATALLVALVHGVPA